MLCPGGPSRGRVFKLRIKVIAVDEEVGRTKGGLNDPAYDFRAGRLEVGSSFAVVDDWPESLRRRMSSI